MDGDFLTTSAGVEPLKAVLTERGYRIFTTGPWWRGQRDTPTRIVIDVAVDAIVDVRSFEKYDIDWTTIARRAEPGASAIPVPRLEDLIAQKLIAAREKDLLDIILVASDASIVVRADILSSAVEARDVEIAVTRGCLEAEAAVASGRMAELWRERYGEEVEIGQLEDAVARVREWIGKRR